MKRLTRDVAVTLGFGFVFLGGAKLAAIPAITAPLDVIGIPDRWWPLIAWGELAIGALLTQPALHKLAAWMMVPWLVTAVGFHLSAADHAGAVVPFTLAVFGLWLWRQAPPIDRNEVWPAPLHPLPTATGGRLAFVVRQVGTSFLFRWAIGGVAFWAALPLLGLSQARRVGASSRRARLEHVLLYLLFYGYGVGGLWNFTGHFFAADMVAASVGWPAGSPFQQELAFYALGTGTVGLLTPWLRERFWIAAALAPSIFVYGAAFTHIEDYLRNGNDAPMNWSLAAVGANLLIPTAVMTLVWLYSRRRA